MRRHGAKLWVCVTLLGCSASTANVPVTTAPAAPASARGFVVRDSRRRVALVIGNGRYAGEALPNPPNDARAIDQKLQRMGFATRLLVDGDRGQMEGAVESFARGIEQGDLVLVFYAGHGVSYQGTNYMVPVSFPFTGATGATLERDAYSFTNLLSRIEARGGTNVFIFDACRNNPLSRSLSRSGAGGGSGIEGLSRMDVPDGTLVVYSTAPGHTATDGDGNHSPFTEALLDRIDRADDFQRILREVRVAVLRRTHGAQRPHDESSLGSGDLVLTAQNSPPPSSESRCPAGTVFIPGGEFTMGDANTASRNAQPPHLVRVSSFCMDRTEVSVDAFRACVLAGRCTEPSPHRNTQGDYSLFCNWGRDGAGDHPANCVDWSQSVAFCQWRGARLPTEAEWEFGARGTAGRTYAWGEALPGGSHANFCGDECVAYASSNGFSGWPQLPGHHDNYPTTAPVDSFASGATPEGLLHMTGNVYEWTADWFGPYSANALTDPHGAVDGTLHVFRGGSWDDNDPSWSRAASRGRFVPALRDDVVGFRCARGVM